MEWNWKRLAITGWVFAAICCMTAMLLGRFLFSRSSHAIYHAVADDRGHRGFDTGDAAHRKAVAAIFAYGNVGQFGRFIADVVDQVLMDDGQTVLAVFLTDTDPAWPKHFISVPVDPKKMAEALA